MQRIYYAFRATNTLHLTSSLLSFPQTSLLNFIPAVRVAVPKHFFSSRSLTGSQVFISSSQPSLHHPVLAVTEEARRPSILGCLVFTKSRQLTNQRSFSSTNAIMPPIDDQLKNQVIKWISDTSSPVVIFSKTTCPYCKKVKELFESLSIKTNVVELDQLPNGSQIQEALLVITGQKTVPNVFVRGRHVGGCDAIVKLHEHGKLVAMARGEPSGPSQAPQEKSAIALRSDLGSSSSSIVESGQGVQDNKVKNQVQKWINDDTSPVVVFSKTTCPYCEKVKKLLEELSIKANVIELDSLPNGAEIQEALLVISGQKTVPNVFIRGRHIGGCDATTKLHQEGKLLSLINPSEPSSGSSSQYDSPRNQALSTFATSDTHGVQFDYDLVVIGGGSGGLATSKEASRLGAKVAVFDFVQPTPLGTTWGLGGTCVNVGCIPKKLMHQAALLGEACEDARAFGWEFSEEKRHDWTKMVNAIQAYIHSLNWKYKVALRDANVTYLNSYAKFADPHRLLATNAKGKETSVTAARFIIATGGRPRYPEIPGAKEFGISSDDVFSLPYPPGKTLCVGASYVSLECAGFLANLGFDTTVMVRSILLRGFDQDMAERIGTYMEKERNVKFVRGAVPIKIEQIEAGKPGKLRVTSQLDDKELVEEYNTVLFAVGRDACTSTIGLENAGVKVNPKTGKLHAENEQTNVEHIYAIGDVLDGRPELTPVAIHAGTLLARRLFAGSNEIYDYNMIPTTVFTPLEYGAIGYSEESAIEKYGKANIEVYHTLYRPLEWAVPGHGESHCYGKLVCNKMEDERVIGLHILGPNAGEITQGYAVGMRLGAKKRDYDSTTGIHPTASEIFTTLSVTKGSGTELSSSGC